jgi:hypothetical protein
MRPHMVGRRVRLVSDLRDRIKAALGRHSGHIQDSNAGAELLVLLPLVLAEMESKDNVLRVAEDEWDRLRAELSTVTAERDAMRAKIGSLPGHTCADSGQPPSRGCAVCDSAPKPKICPHPSVIDTFPARCAICGEDV